MDNLPENKRAVKGGPTRSDTGPFALVPEWFLRCRPSPKALYVYTWLARYADTKGSTFPSRRTLANACNMSVASVDRALKELQKMGAVEREHGLIRIRLQHPRKDVP